MTHDRELESALFASVKETVEEAGHNGDGFWRSCSGCFETSDGYNVNGNPFSESFNCILGGGCHECGGIGAVWDTTDYDAMAREMLAADRATLSPTLGVTEAMGARDRSVIVAWLRSQANEGATYGIASEKGTTRRAAYGGGSLALDRAADAIERGEHLGGPTQVAAREVGPPCENCGRPVEPGQVVLPWEDVGEMHADCEHPYSLKAERGEGDPEPVILLGEPMLHFPVSAIAALVSAPPAQARAMALEEAAKCAEEKFFPQEWHPDYRNAGFSIAAAIRALTLPDAKEEEGR